MKERYGRIVMVEKRRGEAKDLCTNDQPSINDIFVMRMNVYSLFERYGLHFS